MSSMRPANLVVLSLALTTRPSAVILAMLSLLVDNVAKLSSVPAKSIASLCWTGPKICLQFISIIIDTFDAIETFAFFKAPLPTAGISLPTCFEVSHVAFKEPSFWQRCPGISVPNSSVLQKRSLMEIGQRSYCGPHILGNPAADGRVRGSAIIRCCRVNSTRHVGLGKTENFQNCWKID